MGDGLQDERWSIWSGGPKCDFLHIPSLPQLIVSQVSELSGLATFISPRAGWRLVQKGEPSHSSSETWGQGRVLSHPLCPSPVLGTALGRGPQTRILSSVEVALSRHNPERFWAGNFRGHSEAGLDDGVCVCIPVQARKPTKTCVLPEAFAPSNSPACGWVALAVRRFFSKDVVCRRGGCVGLDLNPSLSATRGYFSSPPH